MALSSNLQEIVDTLADIWLPADILVGSDGTMADRTSYGAAPSLTNVQCTWQTTEFENLSQAPEGRTQKDQFFTVDKVYFSHNVTSLRDQTYVVYRSPGTLRNYGYVIIGFAEVRNDPDEGYSKCRLRLKMPMPPGMAAYYAVNP